MTKAITIEHVAFTKAPSYSPDAFFSFWDNGTGRSSIWDGNTWIECIHETHEELIDMAVRWIRQGYRCHSILTGEPV